MRPMWCGGPCAPAVLWLLPLSCRLPAPLAWCARPGAFGRVAFAPVVKPVHAPAWVLRLLSPHLRAGGFSHCAFIPFLACLVASAAGPPPVILLGFCLGRVRAVWSARLPV